MPISFSMILATDTFENAMLGISPWYWDAALRLLAAAVMGGLVGLEREHRGRSAGLRTMMLVSLGACLAMVVSLHFAHQFADGTYGDAIRVDPARVAYGVMAGVGFLGAGAFVRSRHSAVWGLTTGASIWCTAAVGLACGFGMLLVAGAATAMVLFALLVLHRLDAVIPSREFRVIRIDMPAGPAGRMDAYRGAIYQSGGSIRHEQYSQDRATGKETYTFSVWMPKTIHVDRILPADADLPSPAKVTIR